MAEGSGIGWTDNTFNFVWGCEEVSPGCAHCYAREFAARIHPTQRLWGVGSVRRTFGEQHWNDPVRWNRKAEREGRRIRVFCQSMADVFEDHPTVNAEREKLWPLIRSTPFLDWQLCTKRSENMARMLPDDWGHSGYPNVWLGATVENQRFSWRAWDLTNVPAAVRWLSLEPLLGPVNLSKAMLNNHPLSGIGDVAPFINWLVIGGESGKRCRPFDLAWARVLVDQGRDAGAAVFVKQLGGHPDKRARLADFPEDLRLQEFPR